MEETDEAIAKRVQQGDRESFGLLVDRYEPKLLRYGHKFLSQRPDVEDLVQDIFIKTYTNVQSFRTDMKFSPWVYRIAHNEFVNALKKNSRLPISFFDFDTIFPQLFAPETADQSAHDREAKQLIDQSLETLDPKYREPLVLYYLEEMSYQEIAEVLRIPVATVGVRLNRAKTLLQKHATR